MDIVKLNLLGAVIAVAILILCILIFAFRLSNQQTLEYWAGVVFMLTALPIVYLLYASMSMERPSLYFIQLALMLVFIIVELLLDYVFKLEFRQTPWMAISYTMLFFASTGGMIGIASLAGKLWSFSAIVLFLIMGSLAFYQRYKTGM